MSVIYGTHLFSFRVILDCFYSSFHSFFLSFALYFFSLHFPQLIFHFRVFLGLFCLFPFYLFVFFHFQVKIVVQGFPRFLPGFCIDWDAQCLPFEAQVWRCASSKFPQAVHSSRGGTNFGVEPTVKVFRICHAPCSSSTPSGAHEESLGEGEESCPTPKCGRARQWRGRVVWWRGRAVLWRGRACCSPCSVPSFARPHIFLKKVAPVRVYFGRSNQLLFVSFTIYKIFFYFRGGVHWGILEIRDFQRENWLDNFSLDNSLEKNQRIVQREKLMVDD